MFRNSLIIILSIIAIFPLHSQISPEELVQRMGRGINLGNTLSAPIEGNWAPPVEETYFIDVAEAGFKTVRIPIRFDSYTTPLEEVSYTNNQGQYIGSPADYTVEASHLDRIAEVVGWALQRDLVTIIDVHGDHWFWESFDPDREHYKTGPDREAAIDRFRAIWLAISERFKDHPSTLLFEIMNEPYFAMNAPEVHATNMDILSIIRQTNPDRNVIVTGGGQNSWEAPFTIKDELLESDDHLIATFHYYKPNDFTKSSREDKNDFDWGTESDKAEVDVHFDAVKAWTDEKGVPVLLGEFGADNTEGYNYANDTYSPYGGPQKESREYYHRYVAQAAIDREFAFTVWDAGEKSNKTIYLASTRSWVEGVKNAVLGITTSNQKAAKKNDSLTLFPNPVKNTLYFYEHTDWRQIVITDALGKIRFSSSARIEKIDVEDWMPGIYFVSARSGEGVWSSQCIVKDY
jgi:endoglucanase